MIFADNYVQYLVQLIMLGLKHKESELKYKRSFEKQNNTIVLLL